MSRSVISIIVLVCLLLLGGGIWLTTRSASSSVAPGQYDSFAKCLAEQSATMYGAYWCSHCKNQKALFGDSFQYVPYVECTVETTTCTEQGINGYPTWIFADGTRAEGELSLDQLAQKTGCALSN